MALGLAICIGALAMSGNILGVINMSTVKFKKNTYEITEPFDSINISEIECDVQFLPSQDGKCKITATESEKIYNEITVTDGTLNIKRRDVREWYERVSFFGFEDITLALYLPQNEYNNLILKTVSGDTDLPKNFTFRTAKISSTSGDIALSCVVSGDLNVNSISGDVEIDGISSNASVGVKTVSGDIEIEKISAKRLSVNSTSGAVEIKDTVAENDFYANTVSGKIRLEHFDAASLEIKSTSGSVYCELLSQKNVNAKSTSGKINVPEGINGDPCKITTVSGSIKVIFK